MSLPKLDMPHTFTYMSTGSVTPAAHAYGLRPLRAPQARTSQLNSPALSPPGLKPSRSLPPGPGPAAAPSVVHPCVAISARYYTYNEREREKEICIYIYIYIYIYVFVYTYIYIYIGVCGRGLRMRSPLVRPRP